jgi:hypothetical protein
MEDADFDRLLGLGGKPNANPAVAASKRRVNGRSATAPVDVCIAMSFY